MQTSIFQNTPILNLKHNEIIEAAIICLFLEMNFHERMNI